jgi:putative membrane protein
MIGTCEDSGEHMMRGLCLRGWLLLLSSSFVAGMAGEPGSARGFDRDFVMAAEQAGRQEVHDAGIAVARSRMQGVRRLAGLLLEEHRAANARLRGLAGAKRMALPAVEPSPDPTASFSDAEFVAAQIQHHEDAIALYRSEAADGTDREFRQFAAQALPVLQRHLQALRALQTP